MEGYYVFGIGNHTGKYSGNDIMFTNDKKQFRVYIGEGKYKFYDFENIDLEFKKKIFYYWLDTEEGKEWKL